MKDAPWMEAQRLDPCATTDAPRPCLGIGAAALIALNLAVVALIVCCILLPYLRGVPAK